MGFSNGDNCCQLQRIGKLIKEKLLKGIFKLDKLINVTGNTDFVKVIANICEQTTNLSAFWIFFFEVLCAAYTRVFMVLSVHYIQ